GRRDRHVDATDFGLDLGASAAAATAPAQAARYPQVLQRTRIGCPRHARAQAAWCMAPTADPLEVLLSSRRVTDEDVQLDRRFARRRTALTSRLADHAVDVLDNREEIVLGQQEGRHGADGAVTAFTHDRHDVLALLIGEDDLRAEQVRPALIAAAQIRAVTC